MVTNNTVIAGDYKGYINTNLKGELFIDEGKVIGNKKHPINKETVYSYEVIGEESKTSMGSGVVRAAAGAALFGSAGALAGAASAKKKGKHTVSVVFTDGKKCLIEFDDAFFKKFIEIMY